MTQAQISLFFQSNYVIEMYILILWNNTTRYIWRIWLKWCDQKLPVSNNKSFWRFQIPSSFSVSSKAKECGAKVCFCDKEEGRKYNSPDGIWEQLVCHSCGSCAIHAKCGGNGERILCNLLFRLYLRSFSLVSVPEETLSHTSNLTYIKATLKALGPKMFGAGGLCMK